MKKIVLLVSVALMAFACKPESNNNIENAVALDVEEITAEDNKGQWVTITTDKSWSAVIEYGEGQSDWAELNKEAGEAGGLVYLKYTRNTQPVERTLDIVVNFANGEDKRVTLTQSAATDVVPPVDNSVLLDTENVPYTEGSQSITITSNEPWQATLDFNGETGGWAELDSYSGVGDKFLELSWDENTTNASREVTIEVSFDNGQVLTKKMTQNGVGENSVSVDDAIIPYNSTSNVALIITSNVSWTATLQYSGASGWASLTENSGSGNETIYLTPTQNSSQSARSVTVSVSFNGGDTKTATLTQAGNQSSNPPVDGVTSYLELPEVVIPNDNYHFVTHYTTLESGRRGRNFSMLYDESTWTAYWIAYPMSSEYQGSTKRTDRWGYDPIIPQSAQPNLKSSYGGGGGGDEVNSRGHQVASGDRTGSAAMNNQTFFYTNMTPQKQGFNGNIWVKLENKIQGMSNSNDTLWCVTGAIIRTVGGTEQIQYVSKDGKQIPFPNYYYKVIIRKSGSTYKGIGFWFEHFDRSNWRDDLEMDDVKTIRDIEALTGYNFFFNLSQADQESAETSVDRNFWGM